MNEHKNQAIGIPCYGMGISPCRNLNVHHYKELFCTYSIHSKICHLSHRYYHTRNIGSFSHLWLRSPVTWKCKGKPVRYGGTRCKRHSCLFHR